MTRQPLITARPALSSHVGERPHERIVLVVDGALDAGERLDARELHHEAVQVALEFDRAVPGLEREGGGPHEPELGLEEARRQPIGDALVPSFSSLMLGEFEQFEPVRQGKAHRLHGDAKAVAIDEARLGMRLDLHVEGDRLVVDALAGMFQRGIVESRSHVHS